MFNYVIHIFSVDFALKVLQWSDSEMVRLQLWDIAGRVGGLDRNKGRNFGLSRKLPEKKWVSKTRSFFLKLEVL